MRRCLILLLPLLAGCEKPTEPAAALTLATTTSTRDSGLLDFLVPVFEEKAGIKVKVVAVGSGQALEMGRRGDADVLLTHAPATEKEFVAQSHGIERQLVMHNDFVLVGPKSDPAHVSEADSIAEALTRIAKSQTVFVSRGDESGTHIKEKSLWKEAQIEPQGAWFFQAGSGMAQTLRMASEKEAYTLSDRGTFLSQRDHLNLAILLQGDPLLRNQYAVILVNPKKHPHVQVEAARKFADFLLSPEAQNLIGRFGVEKFGEPLFFPQEDGRGNDEGE